MSKLLVDEISDADNTGPVTVTDGAVVNRTGNGTIIDLQSDGTTVGSISSAFSSSIAIDGAANRSGLYLATSSLVPRYNASNIDATVDLGGTSTRFKDLYLSGGVYLGGTGAANYLDSYEEGNWTATLGSNGTHPTITQGNTINCTYTKIGNVCTVHGYSGLRSITAVGTGSPRIMGLPFTATNYAQPTFAHGNMFPNSVSGYVESGQNYFYPLKVGVTANDAYTTGNSFIMFSMTYRVN